MFATKSVFFRFFDQNFLPTSTGGFSINSKRYDVRFAEKEGEDKYNALASGNEYEKKLHRKIAHAIERLKANPRAGEPIGKNKIPEIYIFKYKVKNLFWYPIGKKERLIYTIKGNEVVITSLIIEWFLDHKDYAKRFGYKP